MIHISIATTEDDRDAMLRGYVAFRKDAPWPTKAPLDAIRRIIENAMQSDDEQALIAMDDDIIVGFILVGLTVHVLMPDLKHGWEYGWWVRKSHRGQGIGKALLEQGLTWARTKGLDGFFHSYLHDETGNPRKVQTDYWYNLKEE